MRRSVGGPSDDAPARLRRPAAGWAVAWTAFLLLALLLWSVVYPNAAIIVGSFERGLGDWRDFMASPADREALWGTVVVSIGSVIGALLVGVPLAFLLTRTDFRGRRVLSGVATLPAALPPLVGVLAFLFLYGESGVVTRAVQHVLGLSEAPWTFTGLSAVIFVHAYTMYVYVFLFVSAGLERYDTTLDEAAAGLGASRALSLRRVTLPLLTPSLAGAMLLVFMSALGSFSAPYIFGGGARVLATQILVSKLNGALGLAYVETTVLAVTAVIALLVLRRLQGSRRYTVAGKGRATRAALRSPVTRALLPPLAIALVVLLVLPHAMVILVSFARDGAWTTQVLPPEYTLDNYRRLGHRERAVAPDHEQRGDVGGGDRGQRDRLLRDRVRRRADARAGQARDRAARRSCRGRFPPRRSRSVSRRRSIATRRRSCACCSSGRSGSCRSPTSSATSRS